MDESLVVDDRIPPHPNILISKHSYVLQLSLPLIQLALDFNKRVTLEINSLNVAVCCNIDSKHP